MKPDNNRKISKQYVASIIDHTLLKPFATIQDITDLCNEAKMYGFAAVCVNPRFTFKVAELLKGSGVKTCCVVGFPLGANAPEIKAAESEFAVSQGAEEIDVVISIGALKERNYSKVEQEIASVVDAAAGAVVKVIIETCYLTEEEKLKACECALSGGAHFVKTSTGFGTGGATVDDVKTMKECVGQKMKVKASGGIKTFNDCVDMIKAGADRIGCSAGVLIVRE